MMTCDEVASDRRRTVTLRSNVRAWNLNTTSTSSELYVRRHLVLKVPCDDNRPHVSQSAPSLLSDHSVMAEDAETKEQEGGHKWTAALSGSFRSPRRAKCLVASGTQLFTS